MTSSGSSATTARTPPTLSTACATGRLARPTPASASPSTRRMATTAAPACGVITPPPPSHPYPIKCSWILLLAADSIANLCVVKKWSQPLPAGVHACVQGCLSCQVRWAGAERDGWIMVLPDQDRRERGRGLEARGADAGALRGPRQHRDAARGHRGRALRLHCHGGVRRCPPALGSAPQPSTQIWRMC